MRRAAAVLVLISSGALSREQIEEATGNLQMNCMDETCNEEIGNLQVANTQVIEASSNKDQSSDMLQLEEDCACTGTCHLPGNGGWTAKDLSVYFGCINACCQDYDPSRLLDGMSCTDWLPHVGGCNGSMPDDMNYIAGFPAYRLCPQTCNKCCNDGFTNEYYSSKGRSFEYYTDSQADAEAPPPKKPPVPEEADDAAPPPTKPVPEEAKLHHTPMHELIFAIFVVGKVTSDSARLLLEISPTTSLPQEPLVTVKGDGGSFEPQALSDGQKQKMIEGKPVPFFFTGLSPARRYTVEFHSNMKTPDWLKDTKAGFSTFPTHFSLQNDRRFELAFYSCSQQNEFIEKTILPSQDLFQPLNKEVSNLDVMLHLGDNVYLDDNRYAYEPGDLTAPEGCGYCQGEVLLHGKPADAWEEHRKTIEEHFRDVYRRAWSHPSTAKTLAQVPNFFVPDDHEIKNDFGYPELDDDPTGVHAYLAEIAYEVLLDYELQPMIDIVDPKRRPPFFTAESFGDVGLLILDLRMEKYFANSSSQERFLGSRQWQFLREALRPGGSLDDSKMLVVGMPMPLAYIGNTIVHLMGPLVERNARLKSQISGMWVATPAETQRLLDLLKDWKVRGDREVIFVAGDVHHGLLTDVTYKGDIMFKQVTSSAMANTHLHNAGSAHSLLDVGLRLTSRLAGDLGQGWGFTHQQYVPDNNYGRLSVKLRQVGEVEKATAMISLKITDNAHGHKVFASEAAGCDHDTGGTCYITECRRLRNAHCTNWRCKCQENECAVSGRCIPW